MFFVYGYAKNERDNINEEEIKVFKDLAEEVLSYPDSSLEKLIRMNMFIEVPYD